MWFFRRRNLVSLEKLAEINTSVRHFSENAPPSKDLIISYMNGDYLDWMIIKYEAAKNAIIARLKSGINWSLEGAQYILYHVPEYVMQNALKFNRKNR